MPSAAKTKVFLLNVVSLLKSLAETFKKRNKGPIQEFIVEEKGEDLKESLSYFIDRVCKELSPFPKIASLKEELQQGKYIVAFGDVLSQKLPNATLIDMAEEIADLLSMRFPEDLDYFEKCGKVLGKFFRNFKQEIQDASSKDEVISQGKMSERLANFFEKKCEEYCKEANTTPNAMCMEIDPVIQSGGNYTLTPTVRFNQEPLVYDAVVLIGLASYYDYKCQIARTLLFGTKKEDEDDYKFL